MNQQLFAENEDRRDRIQIYADILKVTKKPTNKTRILQLANIQFHIFQEYIEQLCSNGFLEKINTTENKANLKKTKPRKTLFKATELGLKWCNKVEEVYQKLKKRV